MYVNDNTTSFLGGTQNAIIKKKECNVERMRYRKEKKIFARIQKRIYKDSYFNHAREIFLEHVSLCKIL